MSASMIESWRSGRHPVDLGSSFVRALRAKEGKPPPTRNKIPTKDFYNFRYKFKPESVDDTKTGLLEPKRGAESSFRLEHPSIQQDEKLVFSAVEQSAQNWECVVIYDEETGVYTLEVLDSSLDIQYESRVTNKASREVSADVLIPSAAHPATHSEPHGGGEVEEEDFEQVAFAEAPKPVVEPLVSRKAQPTKPPKSKKISADGKNSKLQLSQPVKSSGKGKGKSAASVQLALPQRKAGPTTNNSSRKVTPETTIHPISTTNPLLVLPSATSVSLIYEGSSEGSVHHSDGDDEDMEPVNTLEEDEDQGQEVDEDAFAAELDDIMGGEEEESTVYRVEDTATSRSTGPVSLNAYAGGQYDDDSSSSDESEG